MSWAAPGGIVWRRRVAISVPIAGSTPVDVDVVIPPEWDEFWAAIDSAGNELRVVWYDSRTVLSYAVDDGAGGAFDATAREGRLRLDNVTVPATASTLLLWLYFDPETTAGDGSTAVTMSTPLTGYIELGRPGQYRLAHAPNVARATKPRTIIHKTANEQVYLWVRYDHALGKRSTPGNRAIVHEEALFATISVQDNAAADQAAMYDADQLRWVWTSRAELWLRVLVKAGTSGTNYTAVILTRTILPGDTSARQQIETRIGIAVGNSLES